MEVYGSILGYMEVCGGVCGCAGRGAPAAAAAGELMPSELYHPGGGMNIIRYLRS